MKAAAPAAHALLSASSSKQWISCPPSARLSEQFEDTAGVAAEEGTLAHALAELLLKKQLKRIDSKTFKTELNVIQTNKLYTPSMQDYIEAYVSRVMHSYAKAVAEIPDAHIYLETRVDYSAYVEEGFGTADVIIITDKVLRFRDLKYGKGVKVDANENPQLMLYALGALNEFGFMFNIEKIEMVIDQPRLEHESEFVVSVEDLLQWAEDVVKPAAKLAFAGEGEFAPSEENCRFCRARGVCKANAMFNLQLAQYEFKPATVLTDDEVSDILTKATQFTNWLKGVKDHAFDQALNHGKKWPGFKIVEGRSNRKYTDEEQLLKVLTENAFYDETAITTPRKLLGITELSKIVGKNDMETFVNEYLVKPPGAPTLVPDSDKRPEYNSAEKDFTIMETEEN